MLFRNEKNGLSSCTRIGFSHGRGCISVGYSPAFDQVSGGFPSDSEEGNPKEDRLSSLYNSEKGKFAVGG